MLERMNPLLNKRRPPPNCERRLLDRDAYRLRRYAIRDYDKRTRSSLHPCWHIKVGRNFGRAGRNSHSAVTVCPGVKDVTSGLICNPYQRIVRRGCKLVPK